MPRFNVGDRVHLVGDIARFYTCVIGVIHKDSEDTASVLNQYSVRLADGTTGVFFDFQLQSPAAFRSRIAFDSAVSKKDTGTRGDGAGRHLYLVAYDVEINLKIPATGKKSLIGQVTTNIVPPPCALITIQQDDRTETKSVDETGEFEFREITEGGLSIEVLTRSRRVTATFTI